MAPRWGRPRRGRRAGRLSPSVVIAKLPWPPSTVRIEDDDTVAVTTATVLWRVHPTAGRHPLPWNALRTWGPAELGRFDPHPPPPAPSEEGVLYVGLTPRTALAETFQSRRVVDRASGAPVLLGFQLTRAVRLLDLSGAWPTREGASQAV